MTQGLGGLWTHKGYGVVYVRRARVEFMSRY
jgi:hypothetical protein